MLNQYLKSEEFYNFKSSIRQKLHEHQRLLNAGLGMARSITNFATNKSPLSFVEGGFQLANSIANLGPTNSTEYFSVERGWKQLFNRDWSDAPLKGICQSVFSEFPEEQVSYGNNATSLHPDTITHLPNADIGQANNVVYFKSDTHDKQSLRDYLIDYKIKQINSNFVSLNEKRTKRSKYSWEDLSTYDLIGEKLYPIPSQRAQAFTNHIKSFLDTGMNRSIIFQGSPGSGKSTIIQTVIHNLQLKTLKFKYDGNVDIETIKYLIQFLQIDAMILDDFDQVYGNTGVLLEFLEWANKHIKVVLGSVNSLKSLHPALLRPGRFGEIHLIEEVEPELLRTLLSDKFEAIGERVKKWPIAYINELMSRLKINPELDLNANVEELDKRVLAALEKLKA